ncbi:unnamed protein product [Meloidogyne enterolobii]|uniref:Uncharacterized protein n=1 Tax=Meloidogyne enterolobii TaxID=390850 RepID=A0ACB0ZGM1_MELEN
MAIYSIQNEEPSQSEFKKQFKFYKRRDCPLDLSAVLDPYKSSKEFSFKLNYVSDKCLNAVEKLFKGINGLRPIQQWSLTTFLNRPGLFIIGGVLTLTEQLCWIEKCLLEYPEPPNITNLFVQNNNPYRGSNVFKNCSKKLRWVTMGNDYNWDTKEYLNNARHSLPDEMAKLSRLVVCSLGLGDFLPDAAIVNFYPEKSHLSPHVDRSERDLSRPLVSISLGQPAIYLTGGTSLNDPVDAIILRSGDILIMSGEQRLVYHGVPRILEEQPKIFGDEFIQIVKEKEVLEYANNCRINITVRQVD